MKSLNIFSHKNSSGFTLIEVMIVIGIFAVIVGSGMVFSFDSYRGYLFRSEYTGVAHIISKARNQAVNNFSEDQHGVYFDDVNHKYVLFIGDAYDEDDGRNEDFPMSEAFNIDGITTIVFEQLTGNVDSGNSICDDSPCEITFDGGGVRVRTLTINEVGGII